MNATLQVYCHDIKRKGRSRDIERLVGKVRGVQSVQTDTTHQTVTVQYDPSRVADSVILRLLGQIGHRP